MAEDNPFPATQDSSYFQSRQRLRVIPGHPHRWAGCQLGGMHLQLSEVIERIGVGQFTGGDQAQEHEGAFARVRQDAGRENRPRRSKTYRKVTRSPNPKRGRAGVSAPPLTKVAPRRQPWLSPKLAARALVRNFPREAPASETAQPPSRRVRVFEGMTGLNRAFDQSDRRSQTAKPRSRFRPGSDGLCEERLWKRSGPQDQYHPEKEPETELIAANSLSEAAKYVECRFDGDFRGR